MTKICETCHEPKPAKQFFPSRFTPDGLTHRCRPCVFAAARADRAEREERARNRESRRLLQSGGAVT